MQLRCVSCGTVTEVGAQSQYICPGCGQINQSPAIAPPTPTYAPPPAPTYAPAAGYAPAPFPLMPPGPAPNLGLRQATSGHAIAALVLGILSLVPWIGILTGALAAIFGLLGIKAIKRDPQLTTGRGMALTGLIMGIGFAALWLLFMVVIIATIANEEATAAGR